MKRSTLAAQKRFADYLAANPPAGGNPTGPISATQITETTEKRFTNNQELASFAKLGPDGKVADAATKDFFFVTEELAFREVTDSNGGKYQAFGLSQAVRNKLDGLSGGGSTPQPTPLTISITADDSVKLNNGVWGYTQPKNSVTFTVLEEGGMGNYTRNWSFIGPDGNDAFIDNNATQNPTFTLARTTKDGDWQVKCVTSDGSSSKEATFAFKISGYNNGNPTGGTGQFTLRMEYRSKTAVGKPDDSIDFLLYPENATGDVSYTTMLTGINGGHGVEALNEGANGFNGMKAFSHSLRTNGVGQLTVTGKDESGATASATKEITVSGWENG